MVTYRTVFLGAVAISSFLCLSALSYTSPEEALTPPGAPTPTLRTLEQVEPRTPISAAYAITQPGSYYLTGNLTVSSYGITIRTNNVTLDLMGFTLSGDRGSSDIGIWVDGDASAVRSGVCIRNGTVSAFDYGVWLEYARGCRLEDVVCTTNKSYGIYLRADNSGFCKGNVIRRCVAAENGYGIVLSGTSSGQCEGNRLTDCIVERNNVYGILVNGNSGGTSFNEIISSQARSNGNHGIAIDGSYSGMCFGNTIRDCSISDNAGNGINMQAYNGTCSGNRIMGCTIRGKQQNGINLYYAYANCLSENNLSKSAVANLLITNSGGNLVLQNTSMQAPSNYALDASQIYGPIVSDSGSLGTTGNAAHPWANFSR